jgi:hypothetical protein
MTTTIERPAATPGQTSSVFDHISNERFELNETVEQILWDLANTGRNPSSGEVAVLAKAGIDWNPVEWGGDGVSRELSRIVSVKRLMSQAGSDKEYQAAEAAAEKALVEFGKRAPELEKQKARIEAQLAELVHARGTTANAFQVMHNARTALQQTNFLPALLRQDIQADEQAVNLKYKRIREIHAQLRMLEDLSRLGCGSQSALLHAEGAAPHLIAKRSNRTTFIEPVAWSGYVSSRLAERFALEQELRDLELRQADDLVDVRHGKRDYYLTKLGNAPTAK